MSSRGQVNENLLTICRFYFKKKAHMKKSMETESTVCGHRAESHLASRIGGSIKWGKTEDSERPQQTVAKNKQVLRTSW